MFREKKKREIKLRNICSIKHIPERISFFSFSHVPCSIALAVVNVKKYYQKIKINIE